MTRWKKVYYGIKALLMLVFLLGGTFGTLMAIWVDVWNFVAAFGVWPTWDAEVASLWQCLVSLALFYVLWEGDSPGTEEKEEGDP